MRRESGSPAARGPLGARLLVRLLVPARHREFVLGDLEEDFAAAAGRSSRRGSGARWRYWRLALAVRMLFAVVAFVLVIACANVANMLLARGIERRGEAAVRRALGATGAKLMRQQVAESLLLGGVAGLLGLGMAFAFRAVFRGAEVWRFPLDDVPFDIRVVAFAVLVTLSTGFLFGLVPTALSRRLDLTGWLQEAGRRDTRRTGRIRSAITVLQLSLSITLLVGALLLTRTLLNLHAVDSCRRPRR